MTLPYHNIRHTLGVMYHIISIYEYSHTNSDCGFVLEDEDLYILLTSALFHDYNHSGGRFNDDANVYNAKNGLRECLYTYLEDDEQTRIVVEECENAILNGDSRIQEVIDVTATTGENGQCYVQYRLLYLPSQYEDSEDDEDEEDDGEDDNKTREVFSSLYIDAFNNMEV